MQKKIFRTHICDFGRFRKIPFLCKNMPFRAQISDSVIFWNIDLGRPDLPDSRWPTPHTHRQHQNQVTLGTTTLAHSCGYMVKSSVRVDSDWYLGGGTGGRICKLGQYCLDLDIQLSLKFCRKSSLNSVNRYVQNFCVIQPSYTIELVGTIKSL